jgi:protein-glucosylgalactosylhydroxylysine glucosidase
MNLKTFLFAFVLASLITSCKKNIGIDRFALVNRHNISHSSTDSLSCLSVGNGKFAFTVDITGLQTFPEHYEKGIPLGTMSDWGWHSFPNPENYKLSDVIRYYKVGNDSVPYYYQFNEKRI